MARAAKYSIKNEQQLKDQTQDVVDNVALHLGFETARKSLKIRIRFKRGASHSSWNSKGTSTVLQLAHWLTGGFHAGRKGVWVPARPAFDNYLEYNSERVRDMCVDAFSGSGTIREKAYRAGVAVMEDIKSEIYTGSLGLADNRGKYVERKLGHFGHDIPFVATGALLRNLEVVIE